MALRNCALFARAHFNTRAFLCASAVEAESPPALPLAPVKRIDELIFVTFDRFYHKQLYEGMELSIS